MFLFFNYLFLGECPEEACAIEVECQLQNLRSRACFILIKGQKAIIWSGQGLPPHKKAVVESLEKSWPQLATVTDLSRETEGQESETFKVCMHIRVSTICKILEILKSESISLKFWLKIFGKLVSDLL